MTKLIKLILLSFYLLGALAFAETFPTNSVKIVTNLPVGSGPDVFVRKLSQQLETRWKVPVMVENKPGGAGLVALEYFYNLPNTSHNIFYSDFGLAVTTPILYNKENLFDNLRSITIGYNSAWMIITPAGIKDLKSLERELKSKPQFGSWGVGSGGHLCGNELLSILKVNGTHVPYKDHGPWYVDTINGALSFGCTSVGSSESYYQSGKLNYIATTANFRDPAFPNVPTVKELTGHTFEAGEVFSAFYMKSNTADNIAAQVEKDLRSEIQSTAMVELVKQLRGYPVSNTSQQMAKLREEKIKDYRALIQKYNIKVD